MEDGEIEVSLGFIVRLLSQKKKVQRKDLKKKKAVNTPTLVFLFSNAIHVQISSDTEDSCEPSHGAQETVLTDFLAS